MNDNYINEQVLLEQEPLPCAFSVDEVKERLRSTESDALTGVGLTTEEVLRTNKVLFRQQEIAE